MPYREPFPSRDESSCTLKRSADQTTRSWPGPSQVADIAQRWGIEFWPGPVHPTPVR